MLPFQLALDILFYNIIDLYHEINFYDYLTVCADRFAKRKTVWILDSGEGAEEVEPKCVSLHYFAFSSQYYFTITVAMSGIFLSLFGFVILITSPGYNIFADELFEILSIMWFFVCYILEKICILIGRFFKIWMLKNNVVISSDESEQSILKIK